MVFILSSRLSSISIITLEKKFFNLSITSVSVIQNRESHRFNTPKLRHPKWFAKKERVLHDNQVTVENSEFIREVVQDKFSQQSKQDEEIKKKLTTNIVEWTSNTKRTGVIARKIGVYPMWMKNGKKISTTLLQILDNHVVKYYAPDDYDPVRKGPLLIKNKNACLLLGAGSSDPTLFTKEYCGLFKDTGLLPKKYLARFFVSPDAVLPPGTPISALHFQVGNFIDVRGKTIDRGFQGVMKRHGFKGMPASHGVTKTHRRGGNIGGGGEKARVWPGTKMPGHMGNRFRILRGLRILRMNTKYNVIWVPGQAIPGEVNSIVTIYDTVLPLRKPSAPLPFPTFLNVEDHNQPEEIYDKDVHDFAEETIAFEAE